MRIGVFGGSFNPPHNAHLSVALDLLNKKLVDKVIYVPNIRNPYHEKKLVLPQERYNMVKLMIEDYPNLEVSDLDIKKDKQNYTYQTLDELKQLYPCDELYFIIGSDNLKEMEFWGNFEYLISTYKFIVTQRDNDDISKIIESKSFLKNNKSNFILFNSNDNLKLSSTLIREKLFKSKDVVTFVPQKVYNYIKEKGLYNL